MATATNRQNSNNSTMNSVGDWDEVRLQSALDRVQDMHSQLRHLRDTVPSLLRPIHQKHPNPEQLYEEIQSAAKNAVTSVRTFQGKMRDAKTKEILDKVKDSSEQMPGGVESWLVSSHPDWMDQTTIKNEGDLQMDDFSKNGGKTEDEPQESIAQTLDKFKAAHGDADVKYDEKKRNITVSLPMPAKLNFSITWDQPANPQDNPTFKVIAVGHSRMLKHTTQALAQRTRKDDLSWTLQTIFSYHDLRTRRCDTCNKLMNFANEFATVRKGKTIKNEDGTSSIEWKAYHKDCS